MTGQKTNFNNVSDELQDRLQDQLKKIGVGQKSPINNNVKNENIESAGLKENGAELQKYIEETLPEKSGRKSVKLLVEGIYTPENIQYDFENPVEEMKVSSDTTIQGNAGDSNNAIDNKMEKVKPPVPPRVKRPKPDVPAKPKRGQSPQSGTISSETSTSYSVGGSNDQEDVHDTPQVHLTKHSQDVAPGNENSEKIDPMPVSNEKRVESSSGTRSRRRHRQSSEERQLMTAKKESETLNEQRMARREAKHRKTRQHLMSDQKVLSDAIKSMDENHGENKSAERWLKIREYMRSGKLFADNRMPADNFPDIHQTEDMPVVRKGLTHHLEPVEEVLEDGESANTAEAPTTFKSPVLIQILQEEMVSCKTLTETTASTSGKETVMKMPAIKSRGWKILRELMLSGRLKEVTNMSTESRQKEMQAVKSEFVDSRINKPDELSKSGAEIYTTVHEKPLSKAALRWLQIRELLKSGKLVIEIASTENGRKVEFCEKRKLRMQMKSETRSIRKEHSGQSRSKSSVKWGTVKHQVNDDKPSLEREVATENKQNGNIPFKTPCAKNSNRLNKIKSSLPLDNNVYWLQNTVTPASRTINTSLGSETSNGRDKHSDRQIVAEPEKVKEMIQSRVPGTSRSFDRGRRQKESIEPDQMSLEITDKKQTPMSACPDRLTSQSVNDFDKRTNVKERSLSPSQTARNAYLGTDKLTTPWMSPWVPGKARCVGSESDIRSGRIDRQLACKGRSFKEGASPYTTLCRINGFVVMLVDLAEKSAKGDTNKELWKVTCTELAALEGELPGKMSASVYVNAKVDLEFAETIFRDKLNRLISADAINAFCLDDDIEQLKATAVAHYAAGCDEPVLVELRELLSHLHSLACILPETCFQVCTDTSEDHQRLVPARKTRTNLFSVLTKPFTALTGRLSPKKAITLPETEKIIELPEPTAETTAEVHTDESMTPVETDGAPVDNSASDDEIDSSSTESDDEESDFFEPAQDDTQVEPEINAAMVANEVLLYEQKLAAGEYNDESWRRSKCKTIVGALVGAAASVGMVGALVVATDLSELLMAALVL